MTAATGASATGTRVAARRLGMLLAMAMFVLVVDTSLMNVSIFAVVHDLRMTASGAQSAIAMEAVVSAVFAVYDLRGIGASGAPKG